MDDVLGTSYVVPSGEAEKIRNFKELRIWQKGVEVVKEIYQLSKKFPKEELYGLTSQMKRAAISIPANIAEGFKRFHSKEYKQLDLFRRKISLKNTSIIM